MENRGPADGKFGERAGAMEQVALQGHELPITGDCAEGIIALGRPRRPPNQSQTPPQILLDGLRPLPAGTSGCFQLHCHSPSPAHSAAPTQHSPKEKRSQYLLPWGVPERQTWQNPKKVAPAPGYLSTGASHGVRGRDLAEQKEKQPPGKQ